MSTISPAIQQILDHQKDIRPLMAQKNVDQIAAAVAANSALITDDVFNDTMSLIEGRPLFDLKDIYAVRNRLTDIITGKYKATPGGSAAPVAPAPVAEAPAAAAVVEAPAPAAPAPAAVPTPEPTVTPAPSIGTGFGATPVTETPATTAAAPPAATLKKLTPNVDAKLSSEPAGTADVVAAVVESLPAFPSGNVAETAETVLASSVETPAVELVVEAPVASMGDNDGAVIDVEAVPVESTPEAPVATEAGGEEPAAEVPVVKATRGRKAGTAASTNVVDQLLDKIDEKDAEIKRLSGELATLQAKITELGETSDAIKLSAGTVKRLEKVGIAV